MSPLGWLRAMARRQRPLATGGTVTGPAPILNDGCDFPVTPAGSRLPDGVTVTFHPDSAPPSDLAQRMAEALNASTATAEPEQRVKPSREHTAAITARKTAAEREERTLRNCPCALIYSRCYCGRQG